MLELVLNVLKRPGMYFSPVRFETAVAFIDGFDTATDGGLLVGLREWLVVRTGGGNNLAWSAIARKIVFDDLPGNSGPGGDDDSTHARAIENLAELLAAFRNDREAPNGLRQVLIRYQSWLERQSWYGPAEFHWIARD